MMEPDRDIIDELTAEVIAATRGKTPQEGQSCANGILRVALRTLVTFFDRDEASELLRREALDVGIAINTAPKPGREADENLYAIVDVRTGETEWSRHDPVGRWSSDLVAAGFCAVCAGAGFVSGFILARALP